MNYRDLKEKLNQLTEEQLDCSVCILCMDSYAVDDEDRYQFDEDYSFVSDELHPYFQ